MRFSHCNTPLKNVRIMFCDVCSSVVSLPSSWNTSSCGPPPAALCPSPGRVEAQAEASFRERCATRLSPACHTVKDCGFFTLGAAWVLGSR